MKFKAMFQPIEIGNMTVKNRFVVPPMGNNFANTDGTMSEQSVAYYAARAKGGFGLVTIEATVVHPDAKGGPRKPCLYDNSTIDSFKKIIDACHAEGAKYPYSFRMQDLKEMQKMQAHQSRRQLLSKPSVEGTFRRR